MSWGTLNFDQQCQFTRICNDRRRAFEKWTKTRAIDNQKDTLIVADRPGPKAPQNDDYHHTPFHSKNGSGGWLNEQLALYGISEDTLMWVNSATWDGKKTSSDILTAHNWKYVIALGVNASKWLSENSVKHEKFDHPQAHRRFKSKTVYPFILHLLTS